jgi:hypothetical protein
MASTGSARTDGLVQHCLNQSLMNAATLRQLPWRVDEIQFQSLPDLPL